MEVLRPIMETNTKHFQCDFQWDIKILTNAGVGAEHSALEERTFLWMSRPCGTWCLRENRAFLRGSREYETWRFYGEQTRDKIFAYVVEVSGVREGKVIGNLYELDYQKHFRHVKEKAVPAGQEKLIYERGSRLRKAGLPFSVREDEKMGKLICAVPVPDDPDKLSFLLCQERQNRKRMRSGDIKEHLHRMKKG